MPGVAFRYAGVCVSHPPWANDPAAKSRGLAAIQLASVASMQRSGIEGPCITSPPGKCWIPHEQKIRQQSPAGLLQLN